MMDEERKALVGRLMREGKRVPVSCPDGVEGCLVYHYRTETSPVCKEAADQIEADGQRIEELESWKAAEEAHHHLLKRRITELEAAIREITGV